MSGATKRPWQASRYRICSVEPFEVICDTATNNKSRTPTALANAALICRAVNHHEDLVAALRELVACINDTPSGYISIGYINIASGKREHAAVDAARKLLALLDAANNERT